MMSTKRSSSQTSQDGAFTPSVPPIGRADLALVQSAIFETAPDWCVELQGICDEEATLILLPEDGDDEVGPSFVVSRETYGFRVDQVHWDVVTEIGVFESMNDIIDVLRLRLAFCADIEPPASVTLH